MKPKNILIEVVEYLLKNTNETPEHKWVLAVLNKAKRTSK